LPQPLSIPFKGKMTILAGGDLRYRRRQMVIVCCVCKKKLGEKEPFEDKRVTHSYCAECHAKELEAIKKA